MANPQLFNKKNPFVNDAGGPAHSLEDKAALAQMAMTGMLGDSYYVTAEKELSRVLEVARRVPAEYIYKCAVYARENGAMKDMPALLLVILSTLPGGNQIMRGDRFLRVINNGRLLRTFVQICMSGRAGRTSLGHGPKNLVRHWLYSQSPFNIMRASIGNNPSLANILQLAHPRPRTEQERAIFGWVMGYKPYDVGSRRGVLPAGVLNYHALPENMRRYEDFKHWSTENQFRFARMDVPADVPFELLSSMPLTDEHWKQLVWNMSWFQIRHNLNTLARHGVFNDKNVTRHVSQLLGDKERVKNSQSLPYQIYTAMLFADNDVPKMVRNALNDALEAAMGNVPVAVNGRVVIGVDCSGSMSAPVSGYRQTATSAMSVNDVAALYAAAIAHVNPGTIVLPFDHEVRAEIHPVPGEKIAALAQRIGASGGATDCSAPLAWVNQRPNLQPDLFILLSDNESWYGRSSTWYSRRRTSVEQEWNKLKSRNPRAKMVCVNLQSSPTTQATDDESVLNIGGYSDSIFDAMYRHIGSHGEEHWVDEIEALSI